MKYVLDSSIGFKWLVIEKDTDKARRIRDDFRAAVIELIAPDVFPTETTHALTRSERQDRVSKADGSILFRDRAKDTASSSAQRQDLDACLLRQD